jgi:hypothetical protein
VEPYILFTYVDIKYNPQGVQWQAGIRNDLRIQLNTATMEISKYQIANLVEAMEHNDSEDSPNAEEVSSADANSASDE